MKKNSGSTVLWNFLQQHVGEKISLDQLSQICENAGLHHWDRVLRQLRQDGADIVNKPHKWYMLRSISNKPLVSKRAFINKKLRFLVFERDNYTCQACGRTPEDGVKLSPDHIVPVDWGGKTTLSNLQTLCKECNEGKQAWINGEDASIMQRVNAQSSTTNRLKVYFSAHPNEELSVDRLAVIPKTREWTRQIRYLREKKSMDIQYIHKSKAKNKHSDCYIFMAKNKGRELL